MFILRSIVLLQNVITSILMGVYMHRVFFGDINLWIFTIHEIAPQTINAAYVTSWIAVSGSIYLLSQTASVLFRPPGSIWLVIVAWLSSMFPLAEVVTFIGHLGSASPLQWDAWCIWGLYEIADVLLIGISARLLQRSFYGDVQRVGHPML